MSEVSLDSIYERRKIQSPDDLKAEGFSQSLRSNVMAELLDQLLGEELKDHQGMRGIFEVQLLKVIASSGGLNSEHLRLYSKLVNPNKHTEASVIVLTNLFCEQIKLNPEPKALELLVAIVDLEYSSHHGAISKNLLTYCKTISAIFSTAEGLGLDQHLVRSFKAALAHQDESLIFLIKKTDSALQHFQCAKYPIEAKAFGFCCEILGWNFEFTAKFFNKMRWQPPATAYVQEYIDLALEERRTVSLSTPDGIQAHIPLSLQIAYQVQDAKLEQTFLKLAKSPISTSITKDYLVNAVCLIRSRDAQLSRQLENLFYETLDFYQEQQWNFELVRREILAVDDDLKFEAVKNKFARARNLEFPLECLPSTPNEKFSRGMLKELLQLYKSETNTEKLSSNARLISTILTETTLRDLSEDLVLQIISDNSNSGVNTSLNAAVYAIQYAHGQTAFYLEEENAIVGLIRANSADEMQKLGVKFSRLVTGDAVPFRLGVGLENIEHRRNASDLELKSHLELAQKMTNETYEVMSRSFNDAYGFNSLTWESKSLTEDVTWALSRFGLDCGHKLYSINSSDFNKFPGKGIVIQGLKTSSIFPSDPLAALDDRDPYQALKTALPWCANEFDQIESTTYVFLRGLKAIIPPEGEAYEIKGTHYSYLVFNQHFIKLTGARSFLVPTDVLCDLLEPSLIDFMDSAGFAPEQADINDTIYSPRVILNKSGNKLINLGWGSNIGGGLCNAFKPQSPMYHEWEVNRQRETKDRYGHVHKSHIGPGIYYDYSPEKEKKMQLLREGHYGVYRPAIALLNSRDIFCLGLAQHHKGYTAANTLDEQDLEKRDLLVENPESGANEQTNFMIGLPRFKECYLIHKDLGIDGRNNRAKSPIMCIADTFDQWSIPDSSVYIDTYDMRMFAKGKFIQLPRDDDGLDPISQGLWKKYVVPHLSLDKDLRFLDRSILPHFNQF
jgi:hypothetical protein